MRILAVLLTSSMAFATTGPVSPIPEPSSVIMMAGGIVALVLLGRGRRNRK